VARAFQRVMMVWKFVSGFMRWKAHATKTFIAAFCVSGILGFARIRMSTSHSA
jgi:hypothetical protein